MANQYQNGTSPWSSLPWASYYPSATSAQSSSQAPTLPWQQPVFGPAVQSPAQAPVSLPTWATFGAKKLVADESGQAPIVQDVQYAAGGGARPDEGWTATTVVMLGGLIVGGWLLARYLLTERTT